MPGNVVIVVNFEKTSKIALEGKKSPLKKIFFNKNFKKISLNFSYPS